MQKIILSGIALIAIVFSPLSESLAGDYTSYPSVYFGISWGLPVYDEVWIDRYWERRHGNWVWVEGHRKSRHRPRAIRVPGHWERRHGNWVWVEGHRKSRGSKAYWGPRKWERRSGHWGERPKEWKRHHDYWWR